MRISLTSLTSLFVLSSAAWAVDLAPPAKDQVKEVTPAEQPAQRAFLGLVSDEVDDALAYHLKLDNDLGIMVSEVAAGSAADKMGVKIFDVIVACDGQPTYTPRAFLKHIRAKKVGDPVTIALRRGAETVTLSGTLQSRPAGYDETFAPPRGGPREPEVMRRRLEDLMRRQPSDGAGPAPRKGRVEKSDGSVMEWSVEENAKP